MSAQELKAGKQWVERRFEKIAREFGAPRTLAREDRWRETIGVLAPQSHMAYYIELAGHLKRGALTFGDLDIELAGAGWLPAQERLSRQMRDALMFLGSVEIRGAKLPRTVRERL
jgi:hypothetical protein